MRTCGLDVILVLLGCPGGGAAADPPEKKLLDVYGEVPVYVLRVEYRDGMQRLLRDS